MKRVVSLLLIWVAVDMGIRAGEYTKYVNPFIGTMAAENSLSGNTYPGATMPFGMVQLSPDTQDAPDWDNASGYNYNHDTIYGFSHTHLSGTGACDLLDILVLPFSRDGEEKPVEHFCHEEEEALPGFYGVRLQDSGIDVELSSTTRTGIHRYRYLKGARQRVYIDLSHSAPKGSWDRKILQSQMRVVSPTVIEGFRVITGWAKLRRIYFRMEFSKPFVSHVIINEARAMSAATVVNGADVKAFLDFDRDTGNVILCKVGISPVSIDGARQNLAAEAQTWDFDTYRRAADEEWDRILSCVNVEGNETDKQIFYTALYHTLIQPNAMSDVNGDYIAPDYTTQRLEEKQTYYSTFSLWDTFRGAHPLYTIICPQMDAAFVNSMLLQCDRYGYLPIWHLWGQENYCMIGNHAVPVVVDAFLKGLLADVDTDRVVDAVVNSCKISHHGLNVEAWERYGYMPENILSQSVSITLEQAYDDWCVALLTKKTDNDAEYRRFMRRAGFYRNLFNNDRGFFQGKDDKGNWIEPFDPLVYGANGGSPYTEGNAWQYLWYVPHDVQSLISLLGGKKAFVKKLDEFFSLNDKSGETNSNASGFIGQYVHGNEPSHHVAYLYCYADEPRRTQELVHRIIRQMYDASPYGYAGNDDCGQMSAWFVFSAMGFYPVNPVGGEFAIGTPLFDKVTINMFGGKKFVIKTLRGKENGFYVKRVTLNGKEIKGNTLWYDDIMRGGEMVFTTN